MKTILQTIQNEIRKLPLENGCNKTGIPYITAYRFTETNIQMPFLENPYIYIVLDGMLRLYTPSGIMDYMAGQYSISKIDTPLESWTMALSDEAVIEAVSKFFSGIHRAIPSEFIRKNILQEIIYDILCGSCGKQFIQSIVNIRPADEIYEANSWIKKTFEILFP